VVPADKVAREDQVDFRVVAEVVPGKRALGQGGPDKVVPAADAMAAETGAGMAAVMEVGMVAAMAVTVGLEETTGAPAEAWAVVAA
jgi:hypothetical protein